MLYTFTEAIEAINVLRREEHNLISKMIHIAELYNGDTIIPLPYAPPNDMPEEFNPSALLIADIVDTNSNMAASVMPSIVCPTTPGKENSSRANQRARNRHAMVSGTWYNSGMEEVLLPRAFRHLNAYASTCFAVEHNPHYDEARISLHSPLNVYPEPRPNDYFGELLYVGFVHKRSGAWIRKFFPEGAASVDKRASDVLWDILEFHAPDYIHLGIMGQADMYHAPFYDSSPAHLRTWKNKVGCVTVVTPRQVTLDAIESSVMKLTDHISYLGRMNKLELIQAEKSIFPSYLIIGSNGEEPRLITGGGQILDGREGEVNLATGTGVQVLQPNPSLVSQSISDRLEGRISQSGGLDPLSIGVARGASLRTGRAVNTMAQYSLDPRIASQQKLMARYLSLVSEYVMEVNKAYHPNAKMVYFSGQPGANDTTEVSVSDDLEICKVRVHYPMPGADINTLIAMLGQSLQTEIMSMETVRELFPFVANPDLEGRNITTRGLESVLLQMVIQMAQMPPEANSPVTPDDLVQLLKGYKSGKELLPLLEKAIEPAQPVIPPPIPGAAPGAPGMPPSPAQQLQEAMFGAGQPPGLPPGAAPTGAAPTGGLPPAPPVGAPV